MDSWGNGKSVSNFSPSKIIMISPALMTYSFYRDSPEKQDRIDRLLSRFVELSICKHSSSVFDYDGSIEGWKARVGEGRAPAQTLDLSEKIQAFNVIFTAVPPDPPICTPERQKAAGAILNEHLVDAYVAGVRSDRSRYEWYYEGNMLAVALVLGHRMAARIAKNELDEAVRLILEANAGSRAIERVAGIEKDLRQSIAAKCYEAGYEFKFLKKIKGWSLW